MIITFYSYKGGTGRTMALANIAVLLAKSGKRVLVVDFDLEAPGLWRFFQGYQENIDRRPGLLDMLMAHSHSTDNHSINWRQYVTRIGFEGGSVELITSGKMDEEYPARVLKFDWHLFFENSDGGSFIENLRASWEEAYDFVLIDSRTGITDTGGVCTIALPDLIVPVIVANYQSVEGTLEVLRRAQKGRRSLAYDRPPALVLPILSRFDSRTEYESAEEWLDLLAKKLQSFYADWLPKSVAPRVILERTKLPYVAYFSFGEKLPVLRQGLSDPESLGYALNSVARLIESELANAAVLALVSDVPEADRHTADLVEGAPGGRSGAAQLSGAASAAQPSSVTVGRPAGKSTSKPSARQRESIYCPQCPEWYPFEEIVATAYDGSETTGDKVILRVDSGRSSSWWPIGKTRKAKSAAALTRQQRADIVAREYVLRCPRGHVLSNSLTPASVIGLIGNICSGKSHFLAGLAFEIVFQNRLNALGLDVSQADSGGLSLDRYIQRVYVQGEVLALTERGRVDGPFAYVATQNSSIHRYLRTDLTFFDVAGEEFASIRRSADIVRYIFDAKGIILLIDPGGLPRADKPLSPRDPSLPLATRAMVDNLADALEAVTGTSAREQKNVLAVVISKADSVSLSPDFWPPRFWLEPSASTLDRSGLEDALRQYSSQSRDALVELGGGSIVRAAEARFGHEKVWFSAASATNQQAVDGKWSNPEPIGCSIPLAQILTFGDLDRD